VAFSWRCPFCQYNATIGSANLFVRENRTDKVEKFGPLVVQTEIVVCPNAECRQFTFHVSIWDAKNRDALSTYANYDESGSNRIATWNLIPQSRARAFPDYVPATILADYKEACSIERLSPKASATLARRCVQGIIRGFYGVSKSRLIDEMKEIESKVDAKVFAAMNALRDMGNIGAHPEKDINVIIDVEPDEAAALIELVELLIDETYVADNERQKRLDSVTKAAADKAALKSSASAPPGVPAKKP
jgi:hypothetical protein